MSQLLLEALTADPLFAAAIKQRPDLLKEVADVSTVMQALRSVVTEYCAEHFEPLVYMLLMTEVDHKKNAEDPTRYWYRDERGELLMERCAGARPKSTRSSKSYCALCSILQ